jgi:hypothetical protein
LGGEVEFGGTFKELKQEHLVLDGDGPQPDVESSRRMNVAGGGAGPRAKKSSGKGKGKARGNDVPPEGPGESRKLMSWIWMVGEVPGEDENGGLHSCE